MFASEIEIHITTKNRWNELQFTLQQLQAQNIFETAKVIVFDDGSTDRTSDFIRNQFPQVQLLRNGQSRGYMYCRNQMLNQSKALYAVSLDDDAHFINGDALKYVVQNFESDPLAAVLAFRIFWGKEIRKFERSDETAHQVQSFVGCGHAWRIDAWRQVPDYPEYWKFYGEEDFASYSLFKKGMKVLYTPEVYVQHRVDVRSRKLQDDYSLRLQRGWQSGWNLMFTFYPFPMFIKMFSYSIFWQLKSRVFKTEPEAVFTMGKALFYFVLDLRLLIKGRNTLLKSEFTAYMKLPKAKIYFQPSVKSIV
ncbi:glycosyltransferase family 2 protein [Flavobacterium aurantiibacter]|uniref:Glycosyltransferase 2-like domain-containing protein n=1 Tax=Flavobacterium aurantiibacter TaxID=2023067 RepID=A0A256A1A7_9FLAO|nr:glycosyltransferase [Flavobacterium aurantiibacter]OYQ47419.1 hypothetical protein CHX27_03065 [Flavobacterium aurantiibacter]